VAQMKQLTAQLKKDKDVAAQKITALEKRIVDTMNNIQVRELHARGENKGAKGAKSPQMPQITPNTNDSAPKNSLYHALA